MFQYMNYNTQLAKLNTSSATLPIIKILQEQQQLDKRTLFDEVKKYGVGQSAFNTSIDVLHELQLINEKEERFHIRGTISKIQYLTEYASIVDPQLRFAQEIAKVLEQYPEKKEKFAKFIMNL